VQNNSFSPDCTTVPVNSTVTWTWSAGAVLHNVTFDNNGPASPTQDTGTFSNTFAAAGTFTYHCTLHAGMTGTIKVQ